MAFDQHRADRRVERAGVRFRIDIVGLVRGDRRRIRDDGVEQLREALRLDEALALDDFGAVGGEDDGRRPAVVAIAVRQVRPRILVDAQRHVVRVQHRAHGRIAVGFLVHHVAPVAPHRFKVQNDEPVLRAGLREGVGIGMQPVDVAGGGRGKGDQGEQREEGAHE